MKPEGKKINTVYEDENGNVYDDTGHFKGRWLHKSTVAWADRILEAEKKDGHWAAISEMIKHWKAKNPTEYTSVLLEIEGERRTRSNSTGSSKNKSMRYIADIPEYVWQMIVAFYKDKEVVNPYDPSFIREFARRFPEFRVADKI